MFEDISKVLLITDMDGTFLPASKIPGQKTLDAVSRFQKAGGKFSIATGRSLQASQQYFDTVNVNCPIIMCNGGMIYDINCKKQIYDVYVPRGTKHIVAQILADNDYVGCEVLKLENVYVPQLTPLEKKHLEICKVRDPVICDVNSIPDDWYKVLFAVEPDKMDRLIDYINSKNYDGPMLSNTYLRTRGIEFTPKVHLDVLEMAREKLEAPRYNLETIANVMGVDGDIEFHNSLDDVKATFRVFKMLLKEYGDGNKKTEEKIVPLIPLRVKEAKYWAGYSHYQERIYVQTYPYSKTYYDIYRKEWRSDLDADLRLLERDLFAMYHCENIADLINAVK